MQQCELLSTWVTKADNPGSCNSCSLAALTSEYHQALIEGGHGELFEQVNQALADPEDPIGKVAAAMDQIKDSVPSSLREELQTIDCMAQAKGGDI